MKKCMMMIAVVALCAGVAQADVIIVDHALREVGSGYADAHTRTDSTATSQTALKINTQYTSPGNYSEAVLVLVLPDLGGLAISTANLTTFGSTINANALNHLATDLYGLRWQAATAGNLDTEVLNGDESFSKTWALTGNNGTGIMENFYPESDVLNTGAFFSTDATGDARLASWLTSVYNEGAVAGDYIFLRISAGELTGTATTRGWWTNSADNPENAPVLTITTIPEPATVGLLGLGLVAIMARRMRRR